MLQEQKQILEMLANGKITAQEAETLLSLINEEPRLKRKTFIETLISPKSTKSLFIEVVDPSNKNINLNFPLSTLQILSKAGIVQKFMVKNLRIGELPDDVTARINFDNIIEMIESNESGEILNFHSGEGKIIRIYIK